MKPRWDKDYAKISFYAILTFAAIYAVKLLLDAAVFVIGNLDTVFSSAGGFFGKLFTVLSPILYAAVIAYLLDPAAAFFQRHIDKKIKPWFINRGLHYKKKRNTDKDNEYTFKLRTEGAAAVYVIIVLVIALLAVFIIKGIGKGDGVRLDSMVSMVTKMMNDFSDAFAGVQLSLNEAGLLDFLSEYISKLLFFINDFLQNMTNSIISSAASIGGNILNFALGLTIAFFMLRHKEMILFKSNELGELFLPRKFYMHTHELLMDIHLIFMGYIRGQLIDAVIMSILIGAALYFIGIKFAAVIGIFAGIANIIPYFGGLIGFAMSIFAALILGEPLKALYAGIAVLILQQIDGMYIIPKVVGKNVDLSPALVLISISAGGALKGIWGMLLAVPVCAIIQLLLNKLINRKKLVKSAV